MTVTDTDFYDLSTETKIDYLELKRFSSNLPG
jgi:hypothetical protein